MRELLYHMYGPDQSKNCGSSASKWPYLSARYPYQGNGNDLGMDTSVFEACSGPLASLPVRFSIAITTTAALAMSKVLKTHLVILHMAYVTFLRYI